MAKVKTYLPSIHTTSSKARAVFERIKAHPEQHRPKCVWNEILAKCARARLKSMADHGWSGHTDPWGRGANWWAKAYGYALPPNYVDDRNYIESLNRGGSGNVDSAMRSWLGSPGHKRHILGESPFYAEQINFGVAYLYDPDSISKYYWCILSAPPPWTG